MKPFEIKCKIWANNETEAAEASKALGKFVDEVSMERGHAVTARKLVEAVGKWKGNALVKGQIMKHFKL